MERYIYNCYRNYKRELKPSLLRAFCKAPISEKILLFCVGLFTVTGIVTVFISDAIKYTLIPLIIELVCLCVSGVLMNKRSIQNSDDYFERFRGRCAELHEWLVTYPKINEEQIQLIHDRLQEQLNKANEKKKLKTCRIERWVQVIVVPLILAVFSAVIGEDSDWNLVKAMLVLTLVVFIAVVGFVEMLFMLTEFSPDQYNMEIFVQELQGVIDKVYVGYIPNEQVDVLTADSRPKKKYSSQGKRSKR